VEGTTIGGGRDNPHKDEWDAIDDKAHYSEGGKKFTAFNHFIDIKKGPGLFDDYDGYSYKEGSASTDEYQSASDANEVEGVETFFAEILARITGYKVDEGLNWWLNDEYVHAPCHKWYKSCSPSVEKYSFPEDKGIYSSVVDELAARFPLAKSVGGKNKGIPYSVFMPVDNLARYWYSIFVESGDMWAWQALGRVMHAVQDASVPHHATGYNGNWHIDYEKDMNKYVKNWLNDPNFKEEIKDLVEEWNRIDSSPPNTLNKKDWNKTPAKNWRIDQLVTWVALNAYREYHTTYNDFKNGYDFNADSMRHLTKLAVAMSVLVLIKGTEDNPSLITEEGEIINFIGNKNTKELHSPDCYWVTQIRPDNKVAFSRLEEALNEEEGYNGCYYCLRDYHTE
ncbi:hypothetical protein AKJ43_03365, partial [candidate division MSBL1 archaeon SCGC-AAA261D19]